MKRIVFNMLQMSKPPLTSQGERLRFLRKSCKLSRREFSEKHGISFATIRSWELDLTRISKRMCKLMIDAFKNESILVHEDWIYYGKMAQPIFTPNLKDNKKYQTYDSLQLDINKFLEVSDKRVAFTAGYDYLPPAIEKNDVLGAEIINDNALDSFKNKLILVKDNKEKDFDLMTLVADTQGDLFLSTLTFVDCPTKHLKAIDKEGIYASVIWIRKTP